MKTRTLPVADVRNRILAEAEIGPVVITTYRRPAAVLVPVPPGEGEIIIERGGDKRWTVKREKP